MRQRVNLLGVWLLASVMCVVFISCNKDKDTKSQLNLTAIDGKASKVVSMKLQKSMDKKTFSIGDHVCTSTIFDVRNKTFGYGYMGEDGNYVYRIVDVEAGVEIKQIPLLNKGINLVVLDTIRNTLIGRYYNAGIDHVLTVNLNDGSIISDNPFHVSVGWYATYFLKDNEYVSLRSGNVLVFINPYTGDVIRTLNLEEGVDNGVYDRKNNRLIGVFPNGAIEDENKIIYIITVDLNTGKTLNKVIAQGIREYCAFESDYDAETNSYILLSDKHEVLFFDVATGKLNEKYQLDFEITSLKVWRSSK